VFSPKKDIKINIKRVNFDVQKEISQNNEQILRNCQVYEMRYWIETLFGNQKSRGFQLARTHLTNPDKIDRLFLALAIATCMVLGLATHVVIIGETHSVDRSDRRDLSLFQLGYRYFLILLARNRLSEFKMYFRWDFKLPPPSFQPSI